MDKDGIRVSRVYLQPKPKSGYISNEDVIEMKEEAISEPEFYTNYSTRVRPWPVMTDHDRLEPGEIHERVQRDIWNNVNNRFSSSEKREQYVYYDNVDDSIKGTMKKGAYGKADIAKTINGITYLWEIKPHSFKYEKKEDGISQLEKYVEHGFNGNKTFEFGDICPQQLDFVNSEFDFKLTLKCVKGKRKYTEYVTYHVTYEMLEKGLIVYDFTRSVIQVDDPDNEEEAQENVDSQSGENSGSNSNVNVGSNAQGQQAQQAFENYNVINNPWWITGGGDSGTGSGGVSIPIIGVEIPIYNSGETGGDVVSGGG